MRFIPDNWQTVAGNAKRIIATGVLVWLAYALYGIRGELRAPIGLGMPLLIGLYGSFIAQMCIAAGVLRLLARQSGLQMRLKECLGITLGSALLNQLLPARAGTAYRASYLYLRHRVTLRILLKLLSAYYLLSLLSYSITGIVAIGILYVDGHRLPEWSVLGFSIVACASGIGLRRSVLSAPGSDADHGAAGQVAVDHNDVGHDSTPQRVVSRKSELRVNSIAGLIVASVLVSGFQSWLLFQSFAISSSLSDVFLHASTRTIAMLIPLTPGSLGLTEAAVVYLGGSVGYTAADGLMMQAVIRFVSLTSLIVAGIPSLLAFRPNRREYLDSVSKPVCGQATGNESPV